MVLVTHYERLLELIVPDFTLGPMDAKLATLDRFIEEVAAPLR